MTAPPEEWGRASRVTSARIASSFIPHTVLPAQNQAPPTLCNGRAIRLAVGPLLVSGHDLLVHQTAIQGDGYRSLAEGAKVSYDAEQGSKGPAASNVQTL